MTSRRIDQIPASNPVTTGDQIAIWQRGRTRVASISDLIRGPINDVVEGITGVNPGDSLGLLSLKKAANLGDLENTRQARDNLGLGAASRLGIGSGGVALYDDPRFDVLNPKIYAASILDSSTSGRAILTGLPDAARVTLGLGTAATKNIGVSGGVAAYDDPRFAGGGGGGGGAPSTVTASQISDSSPSGRSVVTGTPAQARTAIGADKIVDATTVNSNPPPWTTGRTIYDRLAVTVGNPANTTWPHFNQAGVDRLGCVSAVTGAIKLPVEADQALDGGNPTIIITAGVMGLVETYSTKQTGVGLFGMARVGVDNGRVWGLNVVTSNVLEAQLQDPSNVAHPAQINGIEIDCGWVQPANPVTGSNQLGIWIPAEFYGGRPDGAADAIRVGRYADFGWKNFLSADHGAADRFAQMGMTKAPGAAGASGSPGLYWISSAGGQKTSSGDTNQYKHTYLDITPGGDMLIRPDFFGGQGQFTVANSDLSQSHSIHPFNGFTGARATLGTINITGNANINGTASSSAVQTGTISGSGLASLANISTGNITANGTITTAGINFRGRAVQLIQKDNIPGNVDVLVVL